MWPNELTDITSLTIHLNELKSEFDSMFREGDCFGDAKKLYLQIKELENQISQKQTLPYREPSPIFRHSIASQGRR